MAHGARGKTLPMWLELPMEAQGSGMCWTGASSCFFWKRSSPCVQGRMLGRAGIRMWIIPGCGLCPAGKQVQCDTSSIPNLMEHIPARGPASPWPSTPALGVSQRCCCAPWGHPWSKSHCSCWEASQDGAGRADSSFLIQGWPHKTGMSTAPVPLAASEGMGNVLLKDVSSGLQHKRERKQGGCLRKAGMA